MRPLQRKSLLPVHWLNPLQTLFGLIMITLSKNCMPPKEPFDNTVLRWRGKQPWTVHATPAVSPRVKGKKPESWDSSVPHVSSVEECKPAKEISSQISPYISIGSLAETVHNYIGIWTLQYLLSPGCQGFFFWADKIPGVNLLSVQSAAGKHLPSESCRKHSVWHLSQRDVLAGTEKDDG